MSYSSEVLADSPLLYVRFQETSGSTCANDGSLAGNATAAGTFTRNIATGLAGLDIGIDFDGATGCATYPDTASLDITGDVTYECWFSADTLQSRCLMSKGIATQAGYELQIRATGIFRILKAGTTVIITSVTGTYSATTWTHVAFTRSGNNYALYVNGTSTDTTTSATTIDATTQVLGIGAQPSSGSMVSLLDGKMDEVAVYNTALSGARISAHYAARNTGGGGGSTFVPQIVIM